LTNKHAGAAQRRIGNQNNGGFMHKGQLSIALIILACGFIFNSSAYFWSNNITPSRISAIQFTRQSCCGNNIVACVWVENDSKPYGFIITDNDYLSKTRYATLLAAYSNGSKVMVFSENDNATLPIWGSTMAYTISHVQVSQ